MTKSEKRKRLEKIADRLESIYPHAPCALEYGGDGWRLLIMARLSAQCTDDRVNLVTKELFRKYTSIQAFAEASLSELERDIHSTGFYHNKAKNIIACCKDLFLSCVSDRPILPRFSFSVYSFSASGSW